MSNDTREMAKNVRARSLRMVARANASHIGSALSIVDIICVLYGKVLSLPSQEFNKRDSFILSKGHACVALYATLTELGYISNDESMTYGDNGSVLMNHVSHKVNMVDFSTGSLGHGLPFATGIALANKIKKNGNKVFVLLSDGELDEGSNWESFLFSSHHKLSNLTVIIDYNKLQSLKTVKETLNIEPLASKFEAFGWKVYNVDGHDHGQLLDSFSQVSDGPKVVIANTIKGKGVAYMENKVEWHYKCPNPEQLEISLTEINNAK